MKKTIILILLVLLVFGQTAWAQNTYIECSWDAENKTVVQTPRDIPSDVTTVTSSTTILNSDCWYIVRGTAPSVIVWIAETA